MKQKKERITFAESALLNRVGHNSTAAICATVINDYGDNPSVDLQITDCYRAVNFDFSVHEEDDRDNALYKLDILIGVLTNFREAVSDACDKAVIVQAKREKAVRKKKKAAKKKKNEQKGLV